MDKKTKYDLFIAALFLKEVANSIPLSWIKEHRARKFAVSSGPTGPCLSFWITDKSNRILIEVTRTNGLLVITGICDNNKIVIDIKDIPFTKLGESVMTAVLNHRDSK